MSVNVESLVISWGNSIDQIPEFFAAVPADRPDEFFTVERTGGSSEQFRDMPTVAVQAWANTRAEASSLISDFTAAMWDGLQYVEGISRINLNTVSHFPGSNGEPRYQAVLQIVTA